MPSLGTPMMSRQGQDQPTCIRASTSTTTRRFGQQAQGVVAVRCSVSGHFKSGYIWAAYDAIKHIRYSKYWKQADVPFTRCAMT